MLFINYTSAVHEKCSNKVAIFQYADDFLMILTGDSRDDVEDILHLQAVLL